MKKILSIFVIGLFLFGTAFVAANPTDALTAKTTVLESVISISVPEEVLFQDIAPGYLSERQDVVVTNDGTVDVTIHPELNTSYIGIFENLKFRNVLTDPLSLITDFNFEIMKPAIPGGTRDDTVYMYLDFENYTGNVTGYQEAEVTFVAVPL